MEAQFAELKNQIGLIDTGTNSAVASVAVGQNPQVIAITPDGTRAYVTNFTSPGMVSVIDTRSNSVVTNIPVGPEPEAVAIRGGKNGKKRAIVATARKLAVLLHRLWVNGKVYEPFHSSSRRALVAAA